MSKFISAIVFLSSFSALAATPDDFFREALSRSRIEVKNIRLSQTSDLGDPGLGLKRLEQTATNLFHRGTGNDNQDLVQYWRVEFDTTVLDKNQTQHCIGTLRKQPAMKASERYVSITKCDSDFIASMAQNHGTAVENMLVDLP